MAKSHSVLADIMQHHMPELYSSCKIVLPPPEIEYAESNLSSVFTSEEPTPPEGDHALYTWAIHIYKDGTQAIPKGVVQAQHDGASSATNRTMPELGSSRRIVLEPPTRAMPSASFRLLPPLYCPAGLSAISNGSAVCCSTVAISPHMHSSGTPCTCVKSFAAYEC